MSKQKLAMTECPMSLRASNILNDQTLARHKGCAEATETQPHGADERDVGAARLDEPKGDDHEVQQIPR